MRRSSGSHRTARFRLHELEGWTFTLITGRGGAELDGVYAAADGGRLTARITGLDACFDGPSVSLTLDGRHAFQVKTMGIRDAGDAVEAVRALLETFADGEVTAARDSRGRPAAASPARVRGC